MRNHRLRTALLAKLLGLALVSPFVQAQGPPHAAGWLTVNESKLVLTHAYAFPQMGDEGPATEDYAVLMTALPIPASALTDEFERAELLAEQKIQGLEIVVQAASKEAVGLKLYHPLEWGLAASGAGGGELKVTVLDAERVAGNLFTKQPQKSVNTTYHYQVAFSAPIFRKRPLTTADLESAPAKVAAAFIKAAAARDVRALRAMVTAEGVKDLDGPQGKEILTLLPVMMTAEMRITSLEVTGDTAKVFAYDETGVDKIKLTLVRENQQWKVTQPVKP